MSNLNYMLSEVGSAFELVLTIEFIIDCLGWKDAIKGKWSKIILFLILFIIAQGNGRFSNSQIIIVAIDLILFMIYATIFLKGKIQFRLLICAIPFLIVSVINVMIVEVISIMESESVGNLVTNINFSFMIGFFVSKILFYLLLEQVKKLIKNSFQYLQTVQIIIISVLIIYSVIMEFCILYLVSKEHVVGIPIILAVVVSCGIIFLSVYMIYSIYRTAKQNIELIKMNILKIENQETRRQLRELKNSEQRIRKLEHDYKNHCLNIGELHKKEKYCDVEKKKKRIIDNYLLSEKIYIETQNSILDAVLNTKIFQAKQEKIDMSCFVVGNLSELDGMDYGSILFNLLDNAIEATRKNEYVEKKIICNINRDGSKTEIFVKNSIDKSVLQVNKDLITCKENKKLHGMGHQIVKNLVEKMNGLIDFYEEDEMFCVHLYILQ